MEGFQKHWFQGLTGGMDQATDPTLVQNNESPLLLNITLDQPGNWAGRDGTSALDVRLNSADIGRGLFTYNAASGTSTFLASSNRNLYAYNGSSWSSVEANKWPASKRVDGANFLNRLYLGSSDGATSLSYSTGSTTTNVQPSGDTNYVIGGNILESTKNTLIVGGNSIKPGTIFFTNPFTDTFYTSNGTVAANADVNGANTVVTTAAIFEPEDIGAILYNSNDGSMLRITAWTSATIPYVTVDGSTAAWDNDKVYVIRNIFEQDGACTGIRAYQENVVSFDEQNMYVWDPTSPTWSRVFTGFGCVNSRTPQVVDGVLIWANRDGIYLWGGDGRPQDITAKIRDRVGGTGIWDLVDPAQYASMCAGVQRAEGKYYLSVGTLTALSGAPASATSNTVLVFDTKKGSWTIRSYPEQIYAFREFTDSSGNKDLHAITSNALIVRMDSGTTDAAVAGATGISYKAQTPHYALGDPSVYSHVSEFFAKYVSTNTITVKLSVNRGSYTTLTTLPAASSVTTIGMLPIAGSEGFSHSLEFSGTASTTMTIEGIGFISKNLHTLQTVRV